MGIGIGEGMFFDADCLLDEMKEEPRRMCEAVSLNDVECCGDVPVLLPSWVGVRRNKLIINTKPTPAAYHLCYVI